MSLAQAIRVAMMSEAALEIWDSPGYRERISWLASFINQKTATLDEIEAYRAHLVTFRLMDGIDEELFNEAMRRADEAAHARRL